jgi:hypothetical protein
MITYLLYVIYIDEVNTFSPSGVRYVRYLRRLCAILGNGKVNSLRPCRQADRMRRNRNPDSESFGIESSSVWRLYGSAGLGDRQVCPSNASAAHFD